jgi:pyruvate dehydrogenase E1 component alpha subunit
MKWTIKQLQEFEKDIAKGFENGEINAPIHLSGGNEKQLIKIFKSIKKDDYVFSTHRNHYHYLLKGGDPEKLQKEIYHTGQQRSMNFCDPSINFYTSAIVGGGCAIATGVALALKRQESKSRVWCFLGDGASDGGHFWEAVRFAFHQKLPITFIIEDNDRSVDSSFSERWGNESNCLVHNLPIIHYKYTRIYPHVGIGKHVTF